MRVLLFSPRSPGSRDDGALRVTEQVAGWADTRLRATGFNTTRLTGAAATRDALEAALGNEIRGVAFFTHGSSSCLSASAPEPPALDASNAAIVSGRWVYALACKTAEQLAALCVEAGAECYAGYSVTLCLEWDPVDLPDDLRVPLKGLVTEAALVIAEGERDVNVIRNPLFPLADVVARWCDGGAGTWWAARPAHQLVERLEVYP